MTNGRARRSLACILLAIAAALAAPAHGGHAAAADPPVAYRLSFPAPEQRSVQVDVTFSGVIGTFEIRMSRTSPGRYALHEFARNVYDVQAADGQGRRLSVVQPDPHQWNVGGHDGTVQFRYRVFGDRVDGTYAAIDATHAHLNAPATLVWARGLENRPVVVTLAPPDGLGWRAATQLFATADPWTYTAPNLQYLMDSPIKAGTLALRTFQPRPVPGVAGPRPTVALAVHHQGTDADLDSYARDLERLVPETAAVFGEYPAFEGGRFLFLACYVPWATGDGMEHRNSTVLTSSASIGGASHHLLETAVHEFFHAWNVERIRPRSLEPFDFEQPSYARELWFAEGITSYYQSLLMHRAGLTALSRLVADLGTLVNEVVTSPALRFRSAEQMSLMAPIVDGARAPYPTVLSSTYISYYTFGAALGLGLDLAIRERTGGDRSLDDVMRAMWVRHGKPGGARPGFVDAPYSTDDVVAAIAEVTGDAAFASGLIDRHVRGHEPMDYARLLALAGLSLDPAAPGARSIGGVAFAGAGPRLRLAGPPPIGSPAHAAGLGEGDHVVAVDGQAVRTVAEIEAAMRAAPADGRVRLQVQRRGEPAPVEVAVALTGDRSVTLVPMESRGGRLTSAQKAFRSAWLSSRTR
jgi:predicted metalloprotease with PDZ domain